MRAPAPSTAVNNRLGYRTRNGKLKCLEPHFQLSATGSDSKEVMQSAVALPHSRECTKEATPVLPNNGSKVKFGATAELRNILQEKREVKVLPVFDLIAYKTLFCGQCNTGGYGIKSVLRPLAWAVSPVAPCATSELAVKSEGTLPLSSRPV